MLGRSLVVKKNLRRPNLESFVVKGFAKGSLNMSFLFTENTSPTDGRECLRLLQLYRCKLLWLACLYPAV
jgi:hypothetical protein